MENDLDSLRMLTLAEAAELMHLSKRTLSRMIDRKEFPAVKVGSQLRVRERQLTQWIQGLNEL
jgi:excisionase family DNA binding protein